MLDSTVKQKTNKKCYFCAVMDPENKKLQKAGWLAGLEQDTSSGTLRSSKESMAFVWYN